MSPADATEFVSRLPPIAQLIFYAVVGVALAGWAAKTYIEKLKAPTPKTPAEMVLTAGTIADMAPVREAVVELKRIADGVEPAGKTAARVAVALERIAVATERVAEIMGEEAEQADIDREVERRVREQRGEAGNDPPRPRRRRGITTLTI